MFAVDGVVAGEHVTEPRCRGLPHTERRLELCSSCHGHSKERLRFLRSLLDDFRRTRHTWLHGAGENTADVEGFGFVGMGHRENHATTDARPNLITHYLPYPSPFAKLRPTSDWWDKG